MEVRGTLAAWLRRPSRQRWRYQAEDVVRSANSRPLRGRRRRAWKLFELPHLLFVSGCPARFPEGSRQGCCEKFTVLRNGL